MKVNWLHQGPTEYLPKAIKSFGKPVFIATEPNGMAFWKSRGLFDEHILKDEEVKHCTPAHHVDYFYSSIKFYVPPEYRLDVLSISGSISYDGLKKMIRARCAGINANIATLYLAMSIVHGSMTIDEIKDEGLYGSYIRGEVKSHNTLMKEMITMKNHNHKSYKMQLQLEYDPLAFGQCGK